MNARKFYIDTQARTFVSSPEQTYPASTKAFFSEDIEEIQLYFLSPTGDSSAPYVFEDYSANTIKFAIGTTTPAAFQLTWSSVSTGVTVSVTTLVEGSAGSNEVQKITLSQVPVSGGFAVVFPSRNVTVSSVSANVFVAANHGLFNQQSVSITGFSFTGSAVANGGTYFIINRTNDTFSLALTSQDTTGLTAVVTSGGGTATLPEITTPSINHSATANDVESAIAASGINIFGSPQIAVTGVRGRDYTLNFAGACQRIDYPEITIAANTLAAAPGMTANVNFNTTAISALIDSDTTDVTMEVEVSDGTVRQTFQTAATLSDEIISSSSPLTLTTSSFTLNSGDGSTWNITIDNDGILTAAKV